MTVADEAQRCPPSEVLAAFVNARLPRMQVVALTEHLAGCAECRFVVESVSDFEIEERAEVAAPKSAVSWRFMSIAAMIALVLVLTPRGLRKWQTYQGETRLRALIEAAPKNERKLEPRITGFPWAEHHIMRSGGAKETSDDQMIAESKAGALIEKSEGDHSSEAMYLRGIAQLFLGNNKDAIDELTLATINRPNDARAWSDLAAAYIAARKYDQAYKAADRAVHLDPKLNEARFNRALANSNRMPAESKKEWIDYLKHDSTGPWADEARRKLELLQDPEPQKP